MASTLATCGGCGVLIRAQDDVCPHCGARRRSVLAPLASAPILLGLMLAGCPADDSTETMGGSASSSSTTAGTESGNMTMSGSMSQSSTSASTTEDPGTTSAQPPYGVPDTTTFGPETSTGADTDTDTDGSSDSTTGDIKLDLPPDGG